MNENQVPTNHRSPSSSPLLLCKLKQKEPSTMDQKHALGQALVSVWGFGIGWRRCLERFLERVLKRL